MQRLPPTYIDILEQRTPALFEIAAKDLSDLANAAEPFGSCADLPRAREYVEYVEAHVLEDMRRQLPAIPMEEIRRVIADSGESDRLLHQAEIDYLTVINFRLFGSKTFAIEPNLVEHLAHTELNVPSDYVRAPFKSCLFVFDDPIALEAFYRIDGEAPHTGEGALNVFINERPTEEGLRTIIFVCVHAGRGRTHMLVKRQLLIRPDWDIKKMLATNWADLLDHIEDPTDELRFYEDGLQFFRIVLNTILYLGSNDPDVIACLSPRQELLQRAQTSPKWKKLRREAEDAADLPYALVGSRLGRIDVAKPDIASEGTPGPQTYRVGTRFLVRGHWRQQPIGPSRAQRRLTWIRPYIKGPEMAELINRPYTVR